MTAHSRLRCREYLEQEQAWQRILGEERDAGFKARQELELRLMVTECIAFGAVAALVLLLLFGGG